MKLSYSSKSITCSKRAVSGPQSKATQACSSLTRIQANVLQIAKIVVIQQFWPSSRIYLAVSLVDVAIRRVVQNALAQLRSCSMAKETNELPIQALMEHYWSNSLRLFRTRKDHSINLKAGLRRRSLHQWNDVPLASYNLSCILPCSMQLMTIWT